MLLRYLVGHSSSAVVVYSPWIIGKVLSSINLLHGLCPAVHLKSVASNTWNSSPTLFRRHTYTHRHHYSKAQNGIYPVFKFKTQFNFEQKVLSKYYRIDIKMSEYGEDEYKRMQISSKLTSSEMFTKAIDCTAVSNPVVVVVVVIVMIVPVHGLRRMLPVILPSAAAAQWVSVLFVLGNK